MIVRPIAQLRANRAWPAVSTWEMSCTESVAMNRLVIAVALAVLLLVPPTASAWSSDYNYPVKLTKAFGKLHIDIQTYSGPSVVVSLHNRSGRTATCAAAFQSFPHAMSADEIRYTNIDPGQRRTLAYPVRRFGVFSTAFVTVRCVEKDTGEDPRTMLLNSPEGAPKE